MSTTKQFNVTGMHCASCASIIERTLLKIDGVTAATVNYGTETLQVEVSDEALNTERLQTVVEPLGYALLAKEENTINGATANTSQRKKNKLDHLKAIKLKVYTALPLAFISMFIMGWDILAQFNLLAAPSLTMSEFFHHLLPVMATYVLFTVGTPYLLGLYRFIRYGKANMETLIGLGTVVAFLYSFIVTAFEDVLRNFIAVDHNYYDVTIVVITFVALGKYLEERSKLKTGNAIEKLLNLQAKVALVLRNGIETELPIEQLVHGDIIIIKPGAKIPVDGMVLEGSSYIDESMISGEPVPVQKKSGDTVIAGTINSTGSFTFTATKIGSETLLSHIIAMVENAQGSKAPIQALADKISAVFVPVVLVLAVASLAAWLTIGSAYLGFSAALSIGLTCFVGILVIACPCALGLATPTAIIVGVGKGATEGILIKDAATLQKLHQVDTVVIDKTGTLTKGKPEIVSINNTSGLPDAEVLQILASLESKSEHPIASAIVQSAKQQNITLVPLQDFEAIKGKGIQGTLQNKKYYVGNLTLAKDLTIQVPKSEIEVATKQGKTPVLLMGETELIAIVMVADAMKPEAAAAINALQSEGITVAMLTGDHVNTANFIAAQVGITEVVAQVLPDQKLAYIKELQAKGHIVAMAGDGVNDAPALAQADIGIAMGTGTDIAIETAGITLLHGDISKLKKAIRLSKITMNGIKQNLFWAFIYNLAGIPLAAGILYPINGWLLSPVFAGLAMAFSSVSVVTNSLRLSTKKL